MNSIRKPTDMSRSNRCFYFCHFGGRVLEERAVHKATCAVVASPAPVLAAIPYSFAEPMANSPLSDVLHGTTKFRRCRTAPAGHGMERAHNQPTNPIDLFDRFSSCFPFWMV